MPPTALCDNRKVDPTLEEPKRPAPNLPEEEGSGGTLSQWQLIRLRFSRHRVAVASGFVLLLLYFTALFAEIIAPCTAGWNDVEKIYCPPQPPKFNFSRGLYIEEVRREVDPVTLKNYYVETGEISSLVFFPRGVPYKLWGIIPWDRHLFGAVSASGAFRPFYLVGADKYGRDILSRLIYGARISLSIGLVAIAVTFFFGALIGGVSGYTGGAVDSFIQRLIEVINSFPHLPLWMAFAAILPSDWSALQNYFAITIVLSLLGWTGLARVVRGKMLSLREEDYAIAARLLGASHGRVIFRHLLPGFTSHILVSLSLSVPGMILGETALSFLGLGLRPPVVSWGVMLQDCMNIDLLSNYPWLLMPLLCIIITVLAFNFFGDGLRDAADPYGS